MDENNYGKEIPIQLGLDTSSLEATIDRLVKVLNSADNNNNNNNNNESKNKKKKTLREQIDDFNKTVIKNTKTNFKTMFAEFADKLKDVFSDALSELKSITSYSTMTDENVRELKLGYGFSSSQAYGFDKALSVTGIGSMEDLMWANDTQLAQFKKAFEKYSTYYQETMTPDYVAKQIEFQSEMEMFKQDVQNEIIDFFMNHKDEIIFAMDAVMTLADTALEILSFIVEHFGSGDARSAEQAKRDASSIISSYVSSPTTNNVNTTNNFTGVSESDKTWLTQSVQLAYRQSITMLNNS